MYKFENFNPATFFRKDTTDRQRGAFARAGFAGLYFIAGVSYIQASPYIDEERGLFGSPRRRTEITRMLATADLLISDVLKLREEVDKPWGAWDLWHLLSDILKALEPDEYFHIKGVEADVYGEHLIAAMGLRYADLAISAANRAQERGECIGDSLNYVIGATVCADSAHHHWQWRQEQMGKTIKPEAVKELAKAKAVELISNQARNRALQRHRENHDMKAQALAYYEAHMSEYKSKDAAAEAIAGKVVPVKFRTVRNWIALYHKQLQSARTL